MPCNPFLLDNLTLFQHLMCCFTSSRTAGTNKLSGTFTPYSVREEFVFSDLLVHDDVAAAEHVAFRRLNDVTNLLEQIGFDILCRAPMFVVTEERIDTASAWYRFFWKALTYPVRKLQLVGFPIGGVLYPFELLLTKIRQESCTTEIVVCRKRRKDTSADLAGE
jgi:hypothetical protein